MSDIEDLLTPRSQIKCCLPTAWSGLNPVKHETNHDQSQIINGNTLQNLSNEQINAISTNKHLKQQTVIIAGLAEDLQEQGQDDNKAFETFQVFLVGLRLFRESIKYQRKGGILKKWFALAYMWVIEKEKGYFTLRDLMRFTSWSKEGAGRYLQYWLIGELIIEYRPRKRKTGLSFFCLSSKSKARLLRGWVHSLGATYRKPGQIFPGELVQTMRKECQMSLSEFAQALKMSVPQLYAVENGRSLLTHQKSALLVDQFYYLLPTTYWSEAIKDEVKQGLRPIYGNSMHLEKGKAGLSHLEIVSNAYLELKKIKDL